MKKINTAKVMKFFISLTVFTLIFLMSEISFAEKHTNSSASDSNLKESVQNTKPLLTLVITNNKSGYKLGNEIPVVFTITNKGNTDYQFTDRDHDLSGRLPNYILTATDEKGNKTSDPRAKKIKVSRGGGLGTRRKLSPGENFTKTISLNRWALITKPGQYTITGSYYIDRKNGSIKLHPISIQIKERTKEELEKYVEKLGDQLSSTADSELRKKLVKKLMYTGNSKIVPILIDALFKSDDINYWFTEAFNYYLPFDQKTTDSLFAAAENRGLLEGIFLVLKKRGINNAPFKQLITKSLSSKNPHVWKGAAFAARFYYDDKFIPSLTKIALNSKGTTRHRAIDALSKNPTKDSIGALKKLANNSEKSIRKIAEEAIKRDVEKGMRDVGKIVR